MHQVSQLMVGVYDWRLVLMSLVVAFVASYTALDLASRITLLQHWQRLTWLIGGAFAMGTGIWSMHFTGMLALSMPMEITYNVPLVVVSWLCAMVASGFALFIVTRRSLSVETLAVGGVLMGMGIVAMHYIGMEAMQMPAELSYDSSLVLLSILIAFGASTLALWLAFRLRSGVLATGRWLLLRLSSSLVMAFGITGMHYVGMWAAHFSMPDHAMPMAESGIDHLFLGSSIGMATLLLLGLTLISSMVNQRFSVRTAELDSLFRNNLDAVLGFDLNQSVYTANVAAERITGYTLEEMRSMSMRSLVIEEDSALVGEAFQAALRGEARRYEMTIKDKQGKIHRLTASNIPIIVGNEIIGVYLMAKDITDRREAEEQLRRSEERYRAMLADLSTPLIPISDDAVVMPLVGGMDARRVEQMQTTLLQAISKRPAKWVILDLTGVSLMDVSVARLLLQVADAVRLLGAQVMLTGISAELAKMLIDNNLHTLNVVTQGSLQEGISYAFQHGAAIRK